MKKGQRSSSYPSYTINYCIELVTKIYTNFGSGNYYASRADISKALNASEAYLQTQVSSANQYGLLEMKSGEGYKPSSLFVSIYRPIDDNHKRQAIITAFKSPHLYTELISRFENQILPAESPLANILLHHHSIFDGANVKAASTFLENARDHGFISSDNVLLIEGTPTSSPIYEVETIEPLSVDEDKSFTKRSVPNNFTDIRQDLSTIPFNIPLKGNRTAQIIVPEDVRITDFDFIIDFITLMKRQYD
jgi:hypothetical protein